MPTCCQTPVAPAEASRRPNHEPRPPQAFELTLLLDGITSDDYLQWIRDPEPPSRADLKLTAVSSTPVGNHIRLELLSAGDPPPATTAATAVGFPITPEVIRSP
jgi:hypothetical protein